MFNHRICSLFRSKLYVDLVLLLGASYLSELTGRPTVPASIILCFKSKLTGKISQNLNFMQEADDFSLNPPGKSLFQCQTDWPGNGPAGQF